MKKNKYKHISSSQYIRNRRLAVFFILIALNVFFGASPVFAYLTDSVKGFSLNRNLDDLLINNGTVDFSIDTSMASWTGNMGQNVIEISDPLDSDELFYGPIWINREGDNILTSKVDFITEYQMDKEGGSKESVVIEDNEDDSVCEPFEVIVGDIDNFGYPIKGDPYLNASSKHDMNVYPSAYDAKGTDRRMVGSAFYDNLYKYNKGIVYGFKHSVYYDINGNGHNGTLDGTFYGYKAPDYYTLSNGAKNNYFLYDGYTQVAIEGKSGGSIRDGKDWTYLQKSEPLIFKYDEVTKDIKTVLFQIFTDDIQSKLATNISSNQYFGKASGSIYKVYLNGIEIEEFTNELNKVCQSGPKGNIVTLSLPSKYYYIIEEAGGLDSGGLSLLIDDNDGWNNKYDYITGDSFAIDFAKMVVNGQATGSVGEDYYGTINGYVKDIHGNPVQGVKVVAVTGEEDVTDDNGFFSIKTYNATVKLTIQKDKYETKIIYAKTNETAPIEVVLNYSDIVMQEKYEVEVILTKCDNNGQPLKDDSGNDIKIIKRSKDLNNGDFYLKKEGSIVKQAFNVDFEPDTKYRIDYKLILKDKNSIGDIQNFKLGFTVNNLKVKATRK